MTERTPRVAVLTLVSGEPQWSRCRASVARQADVRIEHVEFSGYGNRDGHAALHRFVEERAADFDVFFKLDADMVLSSGSAVADMLDHWREHGTGSLQAEFPVHDALSDMPIMGVHFYAPGAYWSPAAEALFVDPKPANVIRRDRFADFTPMVEHMPDATVAQAFTYGFHRAIKAFQFGRVLADPWQLAAQWRLLRAVRRALHRDPTLARRAMLEGAASACRQRVDGRAGDYRARAEVALESEWCGASGPDQEAAAGAWRRLRRQRCIRLPLDLVRAGLALAARVFRRRH